jgi:hypothetical protein
MMTSFSHRTGVNDRSSNAYLADTFAAREGEQRSEPALGPPFAFEHGSERAIHRRRREIDGWRTPHASA